MVDIILWNNISYVIMDHLVLFYLILVYLIWVNYHKVKKQSFYGVVHTLKRNEEVNFYIFFWYIFKYKRIYHIDIVFI